MTEYERIREKALLTDEEIRFLRDAANLQENKLLLGNTTILSERAIAQAQLDKALKTDGIEIRAGNQDLPRVEALDRTVRLKMGEAQQDMLKAGFVKVIPKGR